MDAFFEWIKATLTLENASLCGGFHKLLFRDSLIRQRRRTRGAPDLDDITLRHYRREPSRSRKLNS
jgi:hypothetical protein